VFVEIERAPVPAWRARFDGPAHRSDIVAWIVVSPDGSRVFVTGSSEIAGRWRYNDFVTVA